MCKDEDRKTESTVNARAALRAAIRNREHGAGDPCELALAAGPAMPATAGRMSPRRREAGLSLISWLIVIVLAGLVVYAAFQVVPAYIESARIGSALASIKKDARTKSVGQLRTELSNQLMIDSLGDVDLSRFKFTRDGDQLTISIHQPIEKTWLGNLGFVIHSHHSITVTRGDGA